MIRVAENSDGERIRELVTAAGWQIDLDWSDIHPYWLVHGDPVVGCIQICVGKPVGRMEFLATDDSLHHRERAVVVKELLLHATETLRQAGAQMATGIIPFRLKSYKRVLKRRGATVIESGNVLAVRL